MYSVHASNTIQSLFHPFCSPQQQQQQRQKITSTKEKSINQCQNYLIHEFASGDEYTYGVFFQYVCTEIGLWLWNWNIHTTRRGRERTILFFFHLRCFQNDKIRLPTFVRYSICVGRCKHSTV